MPLGASAPPAFLPAAPRDVERRRLLPRVRAGEPGAEAVAPAFLAAAVGADGAESSFLVDAAAFEEEAPADGLGASGEEDMASD